MADMHDLLLLHGTIYGQIAADVPWEDCEDITVINQNQYPLPTMFWTGDAAPNLAGPMAAGDHAVDFVHWTAGPGAVSFSGLEIWRLCLSVFLRHL